MYSSYLAISSLILSSTLYTCTMLNMWNHYKCMHLLYKAEKSPVCISAYFPHHVHQELSHDIVCIIRNGIFSKKKLQNFWDHKIFKSLHMRTFIDTSIQKVATGN